MNITFVYRGFESLGIEYLSAALKKAGHQTSLVFDSSLCNTFQLFVKNINRIFLNDKETVESILNTLPDLVAFSVVYDDYAWTCNIASKLKQKKPDILIIFGGINPTCIPEEVIKHQFVDFVCVGAQEKVGCC